MSQSTGTTWRDRLYMQLSSEIPEIREHAQAILAEIGRLERELSTRSTQRAIDDATVLNAARWLWLRERYDSWTHRIFTVPPGQQRDEAVDAAMRDTASAIAPQGGKDA